MKQQYATHGRIGGQFEAVVPIGLPAIRVRRAAGTVALQGMGGAGGVIGVDLFVQLPEQPPLQFQVVVKVVDLLIRHVFGKFFGEYLCVPGFLRWSIAARRDVNYQYEESQNNTGVGQYAGRSACSAIHVSISAPVSARNNARRSGSPGSRAHGFLAYQFL